MQIILALHVTVYYSYYINNAATNENIMTTLTNAIFTGYTEVGSPAQFKVAAKTRVIGGVEYVEFYDFYDVKNSDDFVAGSSYDVELVNGIAKEV